jgi:hypothetical protein
LTRIEFLKEIFKFFGKNDEELLKAYDMALTTKDKIDWDKLYKKVITSVESRYLPAPKWFISLLPNYIIQDKGQYRYDDGQSVLRLTDRFYVFDMWHVTRTIEEIANHYKNKYGSSFVSFKYYQPEFTIMGRNIYHYVNGKRELYEKI